MKIKGILFDMDGTIVETEYDWSQIKQELGTGGKPILSHLKTLDEPHRSIKWNILEKYEREATKKAVLKEGVPELLEFLHKKKIKTALITNNSLKNVNYLLQKFQLIFDLTITRESGLWKPSAEPLIAAIKKFKINKKETCVIGDSKFDMLAAISAGIPNIFILNKNKSDFDQNIVEVFDSIEKIQSRIESLLDGS